MEKRVQDYSKEILKIIRSNTSPAVMGGRLQDYHENDLADVMPKLTVQERCKLYRILDTDMLSDIFEYTDEENAAEYLNEMDVKKAAAILSRMETDALADVLNKVEKTKKKILIDLLEPEVRRDVEMIASFDEDEIGSRMTTNYIVITDKLTVKQAMSSLIEQAAKNDNISTIFVVTEQKRHHMLGDGVGIESGGVTNLHAAPTTGGKIDVVIAGADLDKTQPRRLRKKSVVDENMLRNHCFCVGEIRRAGIRRSDGNLPLCGKGGTHLRLGGDGIITDNE